MELSQDYVEIIQQRYNAYIKGESTVIIPDDDSVTGVGYVVSSLDQWLT